MKTTIDNIIHTVETNLRTSFSNMYMWFGKNDDMLFYKPSNGTWSIAEILEHVSLTNHFLLLIINKTTAKAIKRSLNTNAVTVPDNYMEMLRRVDEVGKHKSFTWIRPEHMEPVGKNLNEVRLLLDAQLERCIVNLPSLGKGEGLLVYTTMTVNNLGKIDVYQYLYFLAKHIDRHITQMQVVETEFVNNQTTQYCILNTNKMAKLKLRGKDLRAIGYPEGPVISVAMNVMEKNYKHSTLQEALDILKNILDSPAEYMEDAVLKPITDFLIEKPKVEGDMYELNAEGISYSTFGAEHIEEGAVKQMQVASRLPVSVAGALMPDAHQGYGLPIGGVLATDNAIIPYAVGVDIGCRMCLSVFNLPAGELRARDKFFERELNANTLFGAGREFKETTEHEVVDRKEFDEVSFLKGLQMKAARQIGSSGSGNHFVEWGIVDIPSADNALKVSPGKYVALLSHSGSRGLGASIAGYYTKIAMEKTKLPQEARHLAWLDLNTQEGMEYWIAMNLAGDYASACHHIIHRKLAKAIGEKPIAMVENHHNFAWKETWEGREVIVHRKGATPAGKDVLGIIPGSMTAPGYIVKGKGELASVNSASHGAGRKMSRTKALQNITHSATKDELKAHGVTLIGGGLDEAPFAYKDIHTVMAAQKQLVDVEGLFYPRIVKMDG